MDAKFLVPGDVISLKLGDVVPADCVLLDGPPLEVDQGAMTGESLPILVYPGENVKMGASVKRGEILANVVATGTTTFFGKARALVDRTSQQGRFQVVLFKVSTILLAISTISVIVILCSLLARDTPALRAIAICVVVLVASIPIAMQVVATSTMAVGARRLAQDGIIVSKLSAIEEMAGMTVLCCDKTGTLTLNQLRISEPVPIAAVTPNDVLFM
jgi:H+-transporting ATPase